MGFIIINGEQVHTSQIGTPNICDVNVTHGVYHSPGIYKNAKAIIDRTNKAIGKQRTITYLTNSTQ